MKSNQNLAFLVVTAILSISDRVDGRTIQIRVNLPSLGKPSQLRGQSSSPTPSPTITITSTSPSPALKNQHVSSFSSSRQSSSSSTSYHYERITSSEEDETGVKLNAGVTENTFALPQVVTFNTAAAMPDMTVSMTDPPFVPTSYHNEQVQPAASSANPVETQTAVHMRSFQPQPKSSDAKPEAKTPPTVIILTKGPPLIT